MARCFSELKQRVKLVAPRFDLTTRLFYVVASQSYSVFYLTAEGKAEGFAGRDNFLNFPGRIKAIDYLDGRQYVVLGAGDTLVAFALAKAP